MQVKRLQEGIESREHGSRHTSIICFDDRPQNQLLRCDHFGRISAEWRFLLDVECVQCSESNVNEASNRPERSTGTARVTVHLYSMAE